MKMTCRFFSLIFLSLLLAFSIQPASSDSANAKDFFAYVGTYTTPGDWRGDTASKGIYLYHYNASTGTLTAQQVAAETNDPSFLLVHPNHKFLYAVNELGTFGDQESGSLSAYSIDPHFGTLTLLNREPSGGLGPCYLSLDRTGKYVLVANYDSGSVSVHPIGRNGELLPASSVIQNQGTGPDKERQEGPHAHWIGVSPDNRFVLVCDLGLDEILIFRFDAAKGTLTASDPAFLRVRPGSGPRHFAFSPNGKFGYVMSEMSAEITAFAYDAQKGTLSPLETIPTLPPGYVGPKEGAEILVHPSGKFLYVSNRGHDAIAIFATDPSAGTLRKIGDLSTQGKVPRAFVLDPSATHLLVANQIGHTIVSFKIDPATGLLTPAAPPVSVEAPTSIVFRPAH